MAVSQISLNPRLIARALACIGLLLGLASLVGQGMVYLTPHDNVFGLVRLFDVAAEQNVPTFFSSALLLLASLLLTLITILKRKQAGSYVSRWAILSCGFLYLATDEAASIHELWRLPMRRLLGKGNFGIFTSTWVIPGIVIIILLVPIFLGFLGHLPTKTRLTFLIAGCTYIGGAIGVEMIESRYLGLRHGIPDLTVSIFQAIEEGMEMAGVIIFIWGLLKYLAEYFEEVRFQFGRIEREI